MSRLSRKMKIKALNHVHKNQTRVKFGVIVMMVHMALKKKGSKSLVILQAVHFQRPVGKELKPNIIIVMI